MKARKKPMTDFGFKELFGEGLDKIATLSEILNEQAISKHLEIASLANLNEKERSEYETSLKTHGELKGLIDTSFEKGEKIGFDKGEKAGFEKMARQIAVAMKNQGEPLEKIANYTGLSPDVINEL